MGEMKPTPGPWKVYTPAGEGQTYGVSADDGTAVVWFGYSAEEGIRNFDDARLIAEAGTVFHTTGLSPVQLVEMVKELKAALGGITAMCEQHGDFRNGVTDPTGTIDEGNVVAGRVIGSARAALDKCEGVK